MKENPEDQGRLSEHGRGLGTVTREMVEHRAREIALINGRSEHHVQQSDFAEAQRELLGQEGLTPDPTPAEQIPEAGRWPFPAGSEGHQTETVPPAGDDNVVEKLVEEGIAEAEHDQEVEATRESLRRDRNE